MAGRMSHGRPVHVAGREVFDKPFHIFLDGRTPLSLDGALQADKPRQCQYVANLLQVATPAPFGRGDERVVDATYRNAQQICVDAFGLSGGLPTTPNMMRAVQSVLYPEIGLGCGDTLYAELDKMAIYGPGGMFKEHVDTPHGRNHIGTLVIMLPFEFEGGELSLSHAGSKVMLPLRDVPEDTPAGKPPADTPGPGGPVIHYAAFFGDCPHEVLMVRRGWRVTITCRLIVTPASAPLRVSIKDSVPFVSLLSRLLPCPKFYPGGAELVLMLEHNYADGGGLSASHNVTVLKGMDRILHAGIEGELRLDCRFCPVLMVEHGDQDDVSEVSDQDEEGDEEEGHQDDDDDEDKDDEEDEAGAMQVEESTESKKESDDTESEKLLAAFKNLLLPKTDEVLLRIFISLRSPCSEILELEYDSDQTIVRRLPSGFIRATKYRKMIWVGTAKQLEVRCPTMCCAPTYGNEPSVGFVYTGVVMRVCIPKWQDRR